jgi:uncharacterized delta-60 repeat protein
MTKWNVLVVAGVLFSGLLLGAAPASAQAGSFDPTFGNDGKVLFDFSSFPALQNGGSFPDASLLDSLGNILVAAESSNNSTTCSQATLLRFLPTGKLDTSFGQSGVASTSFDQIASMTIQPDGKIVLTAPGQLCSGFTFTAVLSRFKSNGAIDTSFGAHGQITFALPIQGQSVAAVSPGSVLVEPDGKIVLTAQEQSIEAGCIPVPHKSCPGLLTPFVARFMSNGSPDKTFGIGGIVSGGGTSMNFGPSGDNNGFALQSDGSILLQALNGGLVELDVNGNFVSPVQIGTIVATTSPSNPVILANGNLVSTAEVNQKVRRVVEFTECEVSRVDANGDPDPDFQTTGFFFTGSKAGTLDQSFCPNIAMAPNGQILVAGTSTVTNAPGLNPELAGDFGLARLNALGGLDSSFGDGGIVTSNFFTLAPSILLVQRDGKIVIVSAAIGATPTDASDGITTLALARFLAK